MSEKVRVSVGGEELELSNLEKVLYPETGFTKGQVVDYYTRVGPVMLNHLEGRPLTLKRYPDGVAADFFFEKECPSFHPEWVETASVPSRSKRSSIDYCMADNLPTLVWLANLASLELHALLCRYADMNRPTMVLFDLDPGPGADIFDCAWTAFRLRELMEGLGLSCYPKTSGKKGIHVCVPLNTEVDFDMSKTFAHAVAQVLERENPERIVSVMKKELRRGKVLIDWSQNDVHKTTVCAYSLRAVGLPHCSTPVTWEELSKAQAAQESGALYFEPGEVLDRLERLGDLFGEVETLEQELPSPNSLS